MLLEALDKEITQTPAASGSAGTSAGRCTSNELLEIVSGPIAENHRNVSYTRLAGVLRARGFGLDFITPMLKAINKAHGSGLQDREIEGIARSVSRYSPQSENRLPQEGDILTIADARDNYYKARAQYGSIRTGFSRLDSVLSFMLNGDVLTVAGRSGAGKTNIGLQLLHGITQSIQAAGLFVSLEMGSGSVFFRLANIYYSKTMIFPFTASDTATHLGNDEQKGKAIVEHFQKILIVDRDSQTIEQVEEHLINARQKSGVDIPIVCVDYIGYLKDTQSGSNYEQVSRIAKAIKALAKRQNIRIILLCQTSREGEDGTIPVKLHHLRDSGAIEESADWILGLWHSSDEKGRIHCEMLKVRHGERGSKFDFVNSGLNLIEEDYKPDEKKKKRNID
jgi:replicative DNA helicase